MITVKENDTLVSLAKKYTGNANMWTELYNYNMHIIGNNPSVLKIGIELNLPQGWEYGYNNFK